jgi:hypothetical protein
MVIQLSQLILYWFTVGFRPPPTVNGTCAHRTNSVSW